MTGIDTIEIKASKIAKVYYLKDELELGFIKPELWVKLYGETGIRKMRYTTQANKDMDMIMVNNKKISEFDIEYFKHYMTANNLFVNRIYNNPTVDLIKRLHDDILVSKFI